MLSLLMLVLLILKAEAMETNIGAVILTANSQSLTYVTNNLSVMHNRDNYTYEDGEDLYFSCMKADVGYLHLSDLLRLEYYNAEGILLFQTKPRATTPQIFRSVLKSNSDNYYLDCIRTDVDTEKEYHFRTIFYMKKRDIHVDADHHAMTLSVNDQILTVIQNKSSYYYDDYLFRYIDGEVLNVTCRKTDKDMRGTLTFYNLNDETNPVVRSPLEGYISFNVSATKINRKTLTFGISNSDIQKPKYARLLFLSDITGNGVRIRGLPRHNILYQYTNDEYQWTIEYQYSVDDTLDLTCISKGSVFVENQLFRWEFNGETSTSASLLSSPTMIMVSKKTFTKILDATHNGKTISCVYIPNSNYLKTERVEIILRLKPEAKSGEIDSSYKTLSNVMSEKSSLLILGSSIGAVLVILGLIGAACWYVRTRTTRSNKDIPCGDLTYQNNSPTPQNTNDCENHYAECYSEIALNRQNMFFETTGSVKNNTDPEDLHREIDVFENRKLVVPSLIYDVPSY